MQPPTRREVLVERDGETGFETCLSIVQFGLSIWANLKRLTRRVLDVMVKLRSFLELGSQQ